MSTTKKILVVGSINADTFIEVSRLPIRGETIQGKDDSGFQVPGGKGANQVVAVAHLADSSMRVQFICSFGNDAHVPRLRREMKSRNIDISLAYNCEKPSGQAFIMLEPTGANTIIIVGGANKTWPKELTEDMKKSISEASVVLLQREIPDYINEQVAAEAYKAHIPVFLDMGGHDLPLSTAILPHLFCISPNETELARLTNGMKTESTEECIAAMKVVQERGVKYVLCTRGKRGSLLLTPKGDVLHQPMIPEKKVVDTTGAGDCFRAAFATHWIGGHSIEESMAFAAAASSVCVEVKGAMPSMPTKKATVQRLNEWKKKKQHKKSVKIRSRL
eukprot:TRINITY_DN2747_c0_g1_i1.p1 TRINITY_DN2747_c0_g1~~TRINITY_DN2747_c0_g1_i1.p1  ORF type:complete len:342 (-),score=79.32 TRINITY_DN2747_c0_g1_i1:66-1064(-)